MVDDGTQVLEAPRYDDHSPTIDGRPGFDTVRLVARMRHGRGGLARVAATVNNFDVRQLTYVSAEFDAATVDVVVHERDAARVEAKLRRMVDVIDVVDVSSG
ncbi:hypothetical protein [Streptomyces sp. SID3343]|uniref:hypothetical protein n=1 Tax=Streptomyces sp. SID3343 TaxID=2690260 RepID=UPI0013713243|nr:hypothetical protein [Streptomyces sp. SID3343]MYW05878.1 hypothetical protein [Streptomyces sp. SID3343]